MEPELKKTKAAPDADVARERQIIKRWVEKILASVYPNALEADEIYHLMPQDLKATFNDKQLANIIGYHATAISSKEAAAMTGPTGMLNLTDVIRRKTFIRTGNVYTLTSPPVYDSEEDPEDSDGEDGEGKKGASKGIPRSLKDGVHSVFEQLPRLLFTAHEVYDLLAKPFKKKFTADQVASYLVNHAQTSGARPGPVAKHKVFYEHNGNYCLASDKTHIFNMEDPSDMSALRDGIIEVLRVSSSPSLRSDDIWNALPSALIERHSRAQFLHLLSNHSVSPAMELTDRNRRKALLRINRRYSLNNDPARLEELRSMFLAGTLADEAEPVPAPQQTSAHSVYEPAVDVREDVLGVLSRAAAPLTPEEVFQALPDDARASASVRDVALCLTHSSISTRSCIPQALAQRRRVLRCDDGRYRLRAPGDTPASDAAAQDVGTIDQNLALLGPNSKRPGLKDDVRRVLEAHPAGLSVSHIWEALPEHVRVTHTRKHLDSCMNNHCIGATSKAINTNVECKRMFRREGGVVTLNPLYSRFSDGDAEGDGDGDEYGGEQGHDEGQQMEQ